MALTIFKVFVINSFYLNLSLDQTFLIFDVWCLMTDACCETNLEDTTDSMNFYVMGYLPLIQMDSSTHMHGFESYC